MRATSSVRTGCDTRLLIAVALSACGRIGFDPTTTSTNDGPIVEDGAGSSQPVIDAPLTACNFGLLPQVGVRFAANTCNGRDLIKGCAGIDREELVIDFVPPTTGSYSVRAYNPGTMTVMNSTALLDPGCTMPLFCTGLFTTTFNAGQHYYFAFESNATPCAQVEVLID